MTLDPALPELNTPRRFYRGGRRILAFRGLSLPHAFDDRRPEEWLASTTHLFAEGGDGATVLEGGTTLGDALTGNPTQWLGPDQVARHGVELGLRAGVTVLTPYSCGGLRLTGPATVFRCRPGRGNQKTSGAPAPESTDTKVLED
jgi:hypothetical protein